ncbi:YsnF/AvaK domain-containing protein [Dermatobacter hominis]|uniref:YsnF/AvaK domain-containing protein n=1 Tax=Dermatobacter hominis TaxID=2884263 RepID=UPI001D1273C5|nr:YsnF/AvaK domain-containing protein [Dermatobacter hominis]UDY37601.1 YsnF/AvaK domain-containing protein [Dermatobacter hominis]
MTRSEEELRVDKTSKQTGKVRLRKWVETEHQTVTVPIRKEKVRLEREPITDANVDAAMDGPELSEEEHEIVLSEEEPVVDTKVVPKERVRLDKDVDITEETVGADVRKERVEVEGDAEAGTRRR